MARLFLRGWEDERRVPKRGRRWGTVVIYKTEKWGWIVRSVPTPSRKSLRVARRWSDWLRLMNILYKYTSPVYLSALRRTEELSGIPARDWFASALAGLLFVIETVDGKVVYSMSHRERFSRSLDVFGQSLGSLLVRGGDVWEGLPAGVPGDVLVVGPDGRPAWRSLDVGGLSAWVGVRACGGRWSVEYTDAAGVPYRLIRPTGEDYAGTAMPVAGRTLLQCSALFRTTVSAVGNVKLRLSVYAAGPTFAMTPVGSSTDVLAVPSADARYFTYNAEVSLLALATDAVVLIVEVRRLGDDGEDTYPGSVGFFGMWVRVV